ncbi:ATP-binding protein [Brevundimonas variabilis]|uniref:histidine kinase n=1 Tax=Brevundimonas variabilis TaxID=74312 RepID=A0A7W9FD61_9CAUL|nr:ATP-binding protein [Brevundimonas variabilis]MBB5744912.1 signal transduction histidine kinase/CheY-like chemotaxis protein [Brevundimonas variabilis]
MLQRFGMGAAIGLIFSPLFGWVFSSLWVTVYFVIQIADLWVFEPIHSGRVERMGRIRSAIGGALLFLNAATFGVLSVPLWLNGGAMGGICAAILLASGAIYAVVNSPSSMRVLAITITPQFLYLAAQPVFMVMNGADPTIVTAMSIAIIVFAAYCLSTWRYMTKARMAESAARLEADQKRVQAEAAMASRAAFLAAVGHDLRTPISAILTGAAELERGASDGNARAQAALITDAGCMMKAMLDDLLDHAKLDAGRMTVEATDFDLRSLLAQTMRLWQGPIRAKGLKLRLEGARDVPTWVRGDAMRMRQILNNLISNAVKFTREGAITVRLRAWADEPSGHAVLIEIVDTGPGMTADQLARLFTPFDQTADGISALHGGSGLGLAISRDLAQLMGGRLTARATPGVGACFTLSLVLEPALDVETPRAERIAEDRGMIARALSNLPAGAARSATTETPRPRPIPEAAPVFHENESEPDPQEDRPLRVLVVDDHDINRRAVELILSPLGCDIATAADGLAALRLCETGSFDVIFMDVRMPELDGRETTRRLRAGSGPNAGVPVIAVTADTAPEDIAACMDAGMSYFVSKPLTPPALLGALNHVLSGSDAGIETVAA